MSLLQMTNVIKSFSLPNGGKVRVLNVRRFELTRGVQMSLEGESGSGKTTLLNIISGLLTPDHGQVMMAGKDMACLPEPRRDKLRGEKIGYMFQTFNLLQGLTALENLILAQSFVRGMDAVFARSLLESVGLKGYEKHKPAQLSVGQQQRVALARALANKPALVLADEPTASLDQERRQQALSLLKKLCYTNRAALLVVSHDPNVLNRFKIRKRLSDINQTQKTQDGRIS